MIASPHMIVGATIGELIQNNVWAFLAGIVSHFVFDAMPHLEHSVFLKDEDTENFNLPIWIYIFEFFEVAVGVSLVIWLFIIKVHPSIFWGAFGAILPDLIDNVPFWSLKLRKLPGFKQLHSFHNLIHFKLIRKNWIFGIPIYIIIIGIAIFVFKR